MPHPKFEYASSQARTLWLHHPVLGDPSWDSFERESALPLFEDHLPDLEGGMHFNLHNNVWGTNFRAWFEGDMRFRFTLRAGLASPVSP